MAMPLSRRKIYLVLIFSQLSQKNGQKSFEPIALIPPIAKQSVGDDHYAKKIYCSKSEKYCNISFCRDGRRLPIAILTVCGGHR
jgi:hypothetical protein